jgi:hypothetical protein
MTMRVSLPAIMARVDQIMAAQQQLASAGQIAPTASTAGAAPVAAAGGAATTGAFASTLAQAQGSSPMTSATATNGLPADVVVPAASWNPQQKPIASWISPVLEWASQHGWSGSVTSGYRSYSEQASLNAQGLYSAPAGKSNHESATYPGGAVDVTDPAQLIGVLRGYTGPQQLVGGVLGAVDPEHFSATGH